MTSRICIVLGPLSEPLADYCERHGITQSQAVRKAIAKMVKADEPELEVGNKETLKQFAKPKTPRK